MTETIRIFVGCSANGEDAEAQAMLEYTVRAKSSQPVEIVWMMLSRDPASPWYSEPLKKAGWNTTGWATPFSPFRWAIPHVCKYQGKAIYMDVDQVVFADVAELWNQPHPQGIGILAKDSKHSCCMLLNNARLEGRLPSFEALRRTSGLYRSVRNKLADPPSVVAPFAGNWNTLDGEGYPTLDHPDIKLIHFTKVETQPHLKWALPRLKAQGLEHWNRQAKPQPHPRPDVQPLVDRLWAEAQAAGYTVAQYIPADPFGSYDAVRGGKPAKAA